MFFNFCFKSCSDTRIDCVYDVIFSNLRFNVLLPENYLFFREMVITYINMLFLWQCFHWQNSVKTFLATVYECEIDSVSVLLIWKRFSSQIKDYSKLSHKLLRLPNWILTIHNKFAFLKSFFNKMWSGNCFKWHSNRILIDSSNQSSKKHAILNSFFAPVVYQRMKKLSKQKQGLIKSNWRKL